MRAHSAGSGEIAIKCLAARKFGKFSSTNNRDSRACGLCIEIEESECRQCRVARGESYEIDLS